MLRTRELVFLVAFFCSCTVKETISTSSPVRNIPFSQTSFKRESSGCKTDSSTCAVYEVTYPVFETSDSTLSNLIQEKIRAYVSLGNPAAEGWSMEETAEDFINDYEEFHKETGDSSVSEVWFYHADVNVGISLDSVISLSVKDNYYTGGAHGGANMYFINIHPVTKKDFTLTDFLKPGYEDILRKEGEKAFREERELETYESLAENGFEFPHDVFTLNENYGFTSEGIVFVFNSYEIAPYVFGPTHFVIPYKNISKWIKNSKVSE